VPPELTAIGKTVREIARRYRVSPDKVRAWIARGEMKAINTADRLCGKPRWVILPEALADFDRSRQAQTPATKPAPRRKRQAGQTDWYPD
jgi:transposase